jgi:tetratricopeptide (TPR) repeat protein
MNRHLLPAQLPASALAALALALLALAGCAGSARQRQELPYEAIRESMEAGDPQAALEAYDRAVQDRPARPDERLLRAELLLAAGRAPEARVELEALAGVSPEVPGALAALGRLRHQDGDAEGALELYQRALRAEPDNFTALHGMGRIRLEQERYPEALDCLDRALAVEQGHSYAYADRARVRAALEDRAGAVSDLDQAVRLDPQDPWNHLDRGKLHLRARRLKAAEADLSRCLELDSGNLSARVLRAGLLDETGRAQAALADYEQVLRLRPDYLYAYAPLAMLHYLQENWDRAGELFEQASRADPSEPAWALLAALSRKQAGRSREAAAILTALDARLPPEGWERQVSRYLADPGRETAVLTWISRESNRVKRGRLLFYLASQFLLQGRTAPALTYLAETAALERRDLPERRIASALLQSHGQKEE